MPDLIINPRFRDVTRPLKPEEYELLEQNILSDGRVYSAIITWNGQIVDGHNRWSIIQKHLDVLGDKYEVQEMGFADEWAVEAWICATQLGRRNLTDEERSWMLGIQSKAEKMSVGTPNENRNAKGQWTQNDTIGRGRTRERIAKQHGVSSNTVVRSEAFANGVEAAEALKPGAKERILSGETKAPKSVIAALPSMEPEQQKEVVEKLMSGESWKKQKSTEKKKKPKNDPADVLEAEPDNVSDSEQEDTPESEPETEAEEPCCRPVDEIVKIIEDDLQNDADKMQLVDRSAEFMSLPKKERLRLVTEDMEAMRDEEKPIENDFNAMLESIERSGYDYINQIRHNLIEYSTTLDSEEPRKRVIAALEKTEAEIKKLKGVIL